MSMLDKAERTPESGSLARVGKRASTPRATALPGRHRPDRATLPMPWIAAGRSAGSSALRRSIRAGKAGSPMLARAKAASRQRRSGGGRRLPTGHRWSPRPADRSTQWLSPPRRVRRHPGPSRAHQGGNAPIRGRSDLPDDLGDPDTYPRIRIAEPPIIWGMAAPAASAPAIPGSGALAHAKWANPRSICRWPRSRRGRYPVAPTPSDRPGRRPPGR